MLGVIGMIDIVVVFGERDLGYAFRVRLTKQAGGRARERVSRQAD